MLTPIIIYQDDDILVINKPSGLVVNRAESVKAETLQDWVEKNIKLDIKTGKLEEAFSKRSGIVHRLDKDTSGVLVIAKNSKAFLNLQKQFKLRKVEKKYLSLVHGKVEPKIGDIKMPLARQLTDRKKFTVRLGGRSSATYYKVVKRFLKNERFFSLLEVKPMTGRTHQIRVHLKHIGYPLVADPIYLGTKRLLEDKKWCQRLFLHALNLKFFHPTSGKQKEFKAEIPKILATVLSKLNEKKEI
ncbi:RluA family pseudouridine synthase [Patescibacteria group bacterium]